MLNRILLSDNGTITDKTEDVNDYDSSAVNHTWVAVEDALYIGTRIPFSEKYFKMSGGVGTLTIQYWDGTQFRDMVDVRDQTSGLSQAGYIKFTPNRTYPWSRVSDSSTINELSSVTIYDQFWLKITLSADTTLNLQWLGDLFCSDPDLGVKYPDLNRSNVQEAFETGKTDWEAQRVAASHEVVSDLIGLGNILSSNQLFEVERLKDVTVIKLAQVIYNGLGSAYETDEEKAMLRYSKQLNRLHPVIDSDQNADESLSETKRPHEVFLYE